MGQKNTKWSKFARPQDRIREILDFGPDSNWPQSGSYSISERLRRLSQEIEELNQRVDHLTKPRF